MERSDVVTRACRGKIAQDPSDGVHDQRVGAGPGPGVVFYVSLLPGEKAAGQFFDALLAGDTDKAYELWKPTASYRKDDFLADWGTSGYYGPVKSYKIMSAKAPDKSDSIAVNVALSPYSPLPSSSDAVKSQKTRVVTLWVSPKDKSLSFPP